ncbi:LOW QUALITY PROTEIN: transmembrane channel-like protein 5 [Pomacea canaliculata]|uniref:LOW QUALITY PROTEIN: transmembrane channel-like protein 5 n=1 Tax=Pomacea canaliculata TaxID=400727 RepID=UPI000D73B416|nr:LOW QUALITY PROTEIN: transmembrane channel-like protein 5 [Pomacea canaliculata]
MDRNYHYSEDAYRRGHSGYPQNIPMQRFNQDFAQESLERPSSGLISEVPADYNEPEESPFHKPQTYQPNEQMGGMMIRPADYHDSLIEPDYGPSHRPHVYQPKEQEGQAMAHPAEYPNSIVGSDNHPNSRLHGVSQSVPKEQGHHNAGFIRHPSVRQKDHIGSSSESFRGTPEETKHYDYLDLGAAGSDVHDGGAMDDLLKNLPSRQLEALGAINMSKTMHRRHSRKATHIHGTVRWQKSPIENEQIDSIFPQESMDPEEEEQVDEAIRGMPTTMSNRRKIKNRVSQKKKKAPSSWKRMKYSFGMSWQHFKYRVANLMYALELWRLPLKQIQGHFGTGVLSYFLFLKWLLLINIPTLLCTLSFLVIPQVLYRWLEQEPRGYAMKNGTDFTGIELLTGSGWFTNTEMYYGFYTNETISIQSNRQYDMKLAYLFTCGGYYFLTLIILGQSILQSYRKYYIETSGTFSLYYINKVLGSWDYGITSSEGVKLKHLSFYNEIKEYLVGTNKETKKKTRKEWCRIFWWRVLMNIIVLGLVAAAGYLIYFLSDERSESERNSITLMILPVCVGVCHLVLPGIFSVISHYERYDKPRYALYMDLIRSMLLRSALLGVLVYFWYRKVALRTDLSTCWETFIGQEIYRLVLIDFLIALVGTFFSEFIRRLIAKRVKRLGAPEFSIGRNTLELIYLQGLCWVGTFFSPLLPFMVVIVLIFVFYVKKISVLQNCEPSVRPWRAARSHTVFLGFLFVFFLFATVSVACGIIFINPSKNCGPYRGQDIMYDVVVELVTMWKQQAPVLADIISFISSPGFLSAILVISVHYYILCSDFGDWAEGDSSTLERASDVGGEGQDIPVEEAGSAQWERPPIKACWSPGNFW